MTHFTCEMTHFISDTVCVQVSLMLRGAITMSALNQMSHVTYEMSHVTYEMSHVTVPCVQVSLMVCGAIKIADLGHSFTSFQVHHKV